MAVSSMCQFIIIIISRVYIIVLDVFIYFSLYIFYFDHESGLGNRL